VCTRGVEPPDINQQNEKIKSERASTAILRVEKSGSGSGRKDSRETAQFGRCATLEEPKLGAGPLSKGQSEIPTSGKSSPNRASSL